MKKNFETRTETEKALSELPQDVQPFKDTDFAKNALSRRQSAERACSLRRKRRLCAALSLAVCLIVAAAAMVSVLLLKDSAGYNGNGDYESKTVFDFGFEDYNGLYGTDFPVLPPDVGGSRTFQTITRTKNRKVVLLCETATEQSLTVQLYVATEESSHSDALDALFPDGCLEETFDGVSVEYFGETALPLTAARFRINRDDVFLVLRQSDSLELLFNILKEII